MSKDRVSLDNNDFFMDVHSLFQLVTGINCGVWTSDLRVLHNITGKIKEYNYDANYN